MLEKQSEKPEMGNAADIAKASALIIGVVPRDNMSVKVWISRTAIKLGWSFSRTKTVWYSEARHINSYEMDALERAAKTRQELRDGRREARDIEDRISRLEAALSVTDEDFNRPQMDALRASSRVLDRS